MRRYYPNAVLAVAGTRVRTIARQPHRRAGSDYIVDHADGSATIHHGADTDITLRVCASVWNSAGHSSNGSAASTPSTRARVDISC